MRKFAHFYRRSYRERLRIIRKFSHLTTDQVAELRDGFNPRLQTLIENYLTDYRLPEGVAVGLKINDQFHLVPMVTEEPSVIAAASNGAQMLSGGSGIKAKVLDRLLTGQIILKIKSFERFHRWLMVHQKSLLKIADQAHPTIVGYGGGARNFRLRHLFGEWCSLDLFADVSEAMGANVINSMLEAVANLIKRRFGRQPLMSILSNYASHSLAKVKGFVGFDRLPVGKMPGKLVAKRIALASKIAQIDPYRAATHNKGIMNGVDAVVIAMGNDWRAVESGANVYAARRGRYRGLSQWRLAPHGLVGEMTLPLALGFVGGATSSMRLPKVNQQIAQVHSARDLMKLTAALGLAQNLAALRAITTDGIQRGHMALQMRSLAMSAGAQPREVAQVVKQLRGNRHPSLKSAKLILTRIRKH